MADQLEERLVDFAVRIIKLSASLPKTAAGNHIAGQILRAGTSPAPNYGEARGAESLADFIHKLRIVLKELNETSIWLRIIKRSQLLTEESLANIIEETTSLCKIFTASLKTSRSSKMTNEKRKTENDHRLINSFDGSFGFKTFSALSTPATGSVAASNKPSWARTVAWSQ